jgi:hypothetical protein
LRPLAGQNREDGDRGEGGTSTMTVPIANIQNSRFASVSMDGQRS